MTTSSVIRIRESIATRLLKKIFFMYILFAFILTFIQMYMEYGRIKRDLGVKLKSLYTTIGRPMANAVWDADSIQINSLLKGLLASDLIYGVTITEIAGESVGKIGDVLETTTVRMVEDEFGVRLESIDGQKNLFGYRYPINYSGDITPKLIGHVTLFTNKLIVIDQIKYQFFFIILTECIKVFILWLVFFWYGRRLLTWPLSGLAKKASEITMDNLQPIVIDVPDTTRNEVTVLRDSFNTMVGNLIKGVQKQKKLYSKLDSLKNNLQMVVNERTKELRENNSILLAQIRERKDAEDKASQYGRILENSLNEIYVFDSNSFKFLSVNEGARKNLGYSAKELEDLTPFDITTDISKEILEEKILPLQNREEELIIFEAIHLRKNSSTYEVEVHLQFMNFQGLEVFVAIILDISEKKILEEQLRQSQKMKAIGTLAGGIAHDFNNLLMGVQGRATLVLENLEATDPNYEHVVEIAEHVKSAENLTQQLLGIARGGKYNPIPVNLYELVKESSSMFGRTKKEITITTESSNKNVVVEVDRHQIEQVLLNIFLNAGQSMSHRGTINVTTGYVFLDNQKTKQNSKPSEPYAMISISDNGCGMEDSILSQVFNPFFTTKERARGTGLGLASAYGIIKNHHGFITVESEVGHGSTFTIHLPVSHKAVDQEVPKVLGIVKGSGKILLVDDEKMIIDVAKAMLEKLGYEVFTALGGQKAIETMKRRDVEFDLVILDLIMPDITGSELFDFIKEIKPKQAVLLSSGYSMDGEATEIIQKGCSGFIKKPFGMLELSHMVKKVLEQK